MTQTLREQVGWGGLLGVLTLMACLFRGASGRRADANGA